MESVWAYSDEQRPEAQFGNQNRQQPEHSAAGRDLTAMMRFSPIPIAGRTTARRSALAMYCQLWGKVLSPSPSGEQGKWPWTRDGLR